MTDTKFTPGPWEFITTNAGNWGVRIRRGYLVLTGQRARAEADAHLIAVAPEMYELLNEIAGDNWVAENTEKANKIDAILAKARGE